MNDSPMNQSVWERIEELRTTNTRLERENQELREQVDKLKGDCEAWSNSYHALEKERDQLRVESERLESCTVDAELHRQIRTERDQLREQLAKSERCLSYWPKLPTQLG